MSLETAEALKLTTYDSSDGYDSVDDPHGAASNDGEESAAQQALNFIKFDPTKCLPQTESVLFNKFPGEIRDLIFYYALCDYEDKSDLYDENTCYRRPGYFAPRRTDTALLRTCQQVYREAWFLPWAAREHTLFLTSPDRCPVRITTTKQIRSVLNLINAIHGKTEINHVRIFPQLYRLEPGGDLQRINDWQNFHPRYFTITLRHTDWWYWESDTPLWINSRFVNECRFPDSVRELRFELESLERRKDQINSIANQMIGTWQFQRKDGVRLSAKDSSIAIMRWSGSSTWAGQRWVRDETRPETLDYYVTTITFKPVRNASVNGKEPKATECHAPNLEVHGFTPLALSHVTIPTLKLKEANVPPGTPAADAVMMVENSSGHTLLRLA